MFSNKQNAQSEIQNKLLRINDSIVLMPQNMFPISKVLQNIV